MRELQFAVALVLGLLVKDRFSEGDFFVYVIMSAFKFFLHQKNLFSVRESLELI